MSYTSPSIQKKRGKDEREENAMREEQLARTVLAAAALPAAPAERPAARTESTVEREPRSGRMGDYVPSDLGHETPAFEPWLMMSLLAVVPMVLALFLPRSFVYYLAAISGMLFLSGLGMLVVQERRRR